MEEKILDEIKSLKELVSQALPKRFVGIKEFCQIKGITSGAVYKDPKRYGFSKSQGRWEIEYSKI